MRSFIAGRRRSDLPYLLKNRYWMVVINFVTDFFLDHINEGLTVLGMLEEFSFVLFLDLRDRFYNDIHLFYLYFDIQLLYALQQQFASSAISIF